MALDDILKHIPIDDIAAKLGVSPDAARDAIEQGGGALLSGLAANAQSESGSAAIQNALSKHEGFTGAASVDDIDENDGAKIVAHVFGDKEKDVAAKLAASDKGGGIDFGKLLPMLAPIVMGLIANKSKASPPEAKAESGGGIGDLVGGLLGGGGSSGGGIGDVIGGLLGGGKDGGGLDLGGMLGGLLGGGK